MSHISPDEYRRVLGHLPTGVTIVTAFSEGEPVGMALNSVTSVSLLPPLLLLCPDNGSSTWPSIRDAGTFCVNVVASHHEHVCRQFARKAVDRFAGVAWHPRPSGPALDEAGAWIECTIGEVHPAGDHTIVIAAVGSLEAASHREPLVFYRGSYGRFARHGASSTMDP